MPTTKSLAEAVSEKIGPSHDFTSNRELADKVGLSEATIRRIRHGHIPSLATLRKLADGIPEWSLLELQRMADLPVVDPAGDRGELEQAVINAASKLNPQNQRIIMSLIKSLLAEQERSPDGSA